MFELNRRKPISKYLERRAFSTFLLAALVALTTLGGYLILERGKPLDWRAKEEAEPPAPSSPLQPPEPETKQIVASFGKNETVAAALTQFGLSARQIYELVTSALPVYDLSKVREGREYRLHLTPEGGIHNFGYPVDDEHYLTVYRQEDQLVPVLKKFAFDVRTEAVSGEIVDSLFQSVVNNGEQERLALELAQIFMWDIDFYTDIKKGDSFRLLVQKEYREGKFVRYGPILAAGIRNQDKDFIGFRFFDEDGTGGYYGPDGKALKKSFLKSPLKFGRITSRFSHARMHPILKIVRPHLGVDYAAPTGTPVVAVGTGTVITAGVSGGSGRMVKLRHTGGYETMYLHLSRIAVRAGHRVNQGEVIGYVGSTGLATGPHLDFRITHHGKFVDPTRVIFPPAPPVRESSFERFAALRDDLQLQLDREY